MSIPAEQEGLMHSLHLVLAPFRMCLGTKKKWTLTFIHFIRNTTLTQWKSYARVHTQTCTHDASAICSGFGWPRVCKRAQTETRMKSFSSPCLTLWLLRDWVKKVAGLGLGHQSYDWGASWHTVSTLLPGPSPGGLTSLLSSGSPSSLVLNARCLCSVVLWENKSRRVTTNAKP